MARDDAMDGAMDDVLVIGGGLAGLACAARATGLGLRARLIEQGEQERYPCNSRYSGGMFHLNYLDIAGPADEIARKLAAMCPPDVDAQVVQAIGVNARRCVQWLQDTADARFVRVGPAPYQKWVLAPPRPPQAGLVHPGRGADRVLHGLARQLADAGRPVLRGTRAVNVRRQADGSFRVSAMQGQDAVVFEARAVVFADGGFQGRPDLVKRHLTEHPQQAVKRNAQTGLGTSVELAAGLGAAISELRSFYGHLLARKALEREDLWPYPMIDSVAKAGILVGADGLRFADEGGTGVYLANQVARRPPEAGAFVVVDDDTWWSIGRDTLVPPNPIMTMHGGELFSDGTLAGLARIAGINAENLARTVTTHNAWVQGGGKAGALAYEPPRGFSAAYARPVAKAPFHAIPVCAGITYTMGGLRVDAGARVRGTDGAVVPGLYAAGAAVGGVEGGEHAFYIGGLCKALVLGVLAAESLARAQAPAGAPSNQHLSPVCA